MEVLQRTANRGSISTGYDIDNSVKLEADNTEYLNRVIASGGNRKTWTISAWVKRTEISDASHGGGHTIFGVNVSGNEGTIVRFNTGTTAATLDTIQIDIGAGGTLSRSHTSQVFRDTSAWYHIVLAVDTTQGTATDRFKLYVNGELVTSYYSRNNPAQNFDTSNNQADNSCTQHIGAYTVSGTAYGKFCGYIAEVNHVDGAALAPTAFGEFDDDSGIWKPIEASPTYGTNGFFLDFADSGNLGDDESGNGLDFTEVNIAAADQATDTPTNNFCTFNAVNMSGSSAKLAEGATFTASTANGAFTTYGTMAPSSGKWWWEGKIQVFADTAYACIGATTNLAGLPSVSAQLSGGHVIKLAKNQKWVLNSTGYTYGATYADADIINVGLDLDNRKFYTYKNGTIDDANGIDISSSTFDGFGSQWMPLVITYGSGGASSYEINFGGYRTYGIGSPQSDGNGYGTFEYAPPSGYYALCTKNLAEFG